MFHVVYGILVEQYTDIVYVLLIPIYYQELFYTFFDTHVSHRLVVLDNGFQDAPNIDQSMPLMLFIGNLHVCSEFGFAVIWQCAPLSDIL